MVLANDIRDPAETELENIEGYVILNAESDTMPATIQLAQGTLMLDFDSLEKSLDTGQPISAEEVYRAYEDYWAEWLKRSQ